MKTKKRPRKVFNKVLSVVLCLSILVSTYGGFFSGFGAAAGLVADINLSGMNAGEVAVSKGAVQDDRSADITVKTAALPCVVTETGTITTEQVLDVIMIIDTSGSMGSSYGNLIVDAKEAAINLADRLYEMNSANRVAVGSFAQYAYALQKNGDVSSSTSTTGLEGDYYIRSTHSGLYLNMANDSSADNARLVQENKDGQDAQIFRLVSTGVKDEYYIYTGASNYTKVLDIASASTDNGASVIQYTYNGAANQKFKVIDQGGYYSIQTGVTNYASCIDVWEWSTTAGDELKQYTYEGNGCQHYVLEPVSGNITSSSGTVDYVEHFNINSAQGGNYFFGSNEQAALEVGINELTAVGGTNTEGGFLVAEALAKAADPTRQTLVVFLTDGLPTGRYKDNGTSVNTVATYDGSGSGIPNYLELTELIEVAERVDAIDGTQTALIFYTGGLTTNNKNTSYYNGCTSATCRCNTANSNHGTTKISSSTTSSSTAEQKMMSAFYNLSDLKAAEHIVNDLLAPYCEAGIYMPENASEMLKAFEDIITEYVNNLTYDAATNAVYTDIIPEYYTVDESTLNVTTGTVEVLKNQTVTIDGVVTTRDVVQWTIGTIPAEVQELTYTININDPKLYGVVDVAEQGILTYTESAYTVTQSPLVVQIDEIILSPKGKDDYYVFKQGDNLVADNSGVSGVKTNDDVLNTLVDDSGDTNDATSIVNGNVAGLSGTQSPLKIEGYTTELVNNAQYGNVTLNDDGTFTYVPNSSLYEQEMITFQYDPNGTNEYNYVGTVGWEDTFTYKLDSAAEGGSVTVTTTTPIDTPELSLVVFDNMYQSGADVQGATAIGGDLTVDGSWTIGSETDNQGGYDLIVGGVITGGLVTNGATYVSNEQWIRDYVDKLEVQYTAISNQYAAMTADGTQAWGTFTAAEDHVAGTPHVFFVPAEETISQAMFSGTFGDDPIIINVAGTERSFWGGQMGMFQNCDLTMDDLYNRLVWNFYECETLYSSSVSFHGCVLAPHASYTATNGHINGTLIVRELNGSGGFEYHMVGSEFNSVIDGITADMETTTTTTTTTLKNYVVSANPDANADTELESEVITVHIRVVPNLSELTAVKSSNPADGATVKPGDTIRYTIEVFNPCGVAVSNVVVNDSAPFGTSISNANGGSVNGRNISFTIASIPANGSASVSFDVVVDSEVTGTNNLSNTAGITYTLPGESESDTVTTNTVNHATLTFEKISSVDSSVILGAGDEITYTIAVTNRGNAAAQNVEVVDTLPDGVTFSSGNVSVNGNVVTYTIASIAAGDTAYVTFTVTVDQITAGAKVFANSATVNGEPTNTVENVTKYGTVVVKYVDESGNELLPSDSAEGKTGSEYGPYPSKVIENYRLVGAEGNPSGSFTEGEVVIIYTYAKIPGYATVYYVDESGSTLASPESITGWQGEEVTDLLQKAIDRYEYIRTDAPTTILTEDGITIIHVYKLIPDTTLPTVVKTSNPGDGSLVKSGDVIVYTIKVTNNKYEDMSNVRVVDVAPKGTTITNAGDGTVNGSTITFDIPTIASGETVTVSFEVTVNAGISGNGNLSNTAQIIYRDREATEDTVIDTNSTGHAILTAVKTGGDAEFYGVGDVYTYYITVTNNGSAAAENIVITDNVPAGTTLYNGSTTGWTIDRLEAGASKTVSFEVQVNDIDAFRASVTNVAYVNDEPTNEVENIVKKGTVDVRFVDEAGNDLADSLHYEGKPGTAHGTVDAIDIYGYALKTTTGSTTGSFIEGNITIVHIYERLVGTAVIHYIDMGSGQDILNTVTKSGYVGDAIDSDEWTEITNYTYVSTDKPEMVYVVGNVDIIHYYTYIEADDTPLDFVKTSNPASGATVNNGDEITYIITLTNTRVDAVNNAVIEDYIPDGMTFISASNGAVYDSGKLTWNIGTIEVGGKATVYFTAKVNKDLTGSGNLRNIASATYSNRDLEPENPIYTNEVAHPILDAKLESFTNQPDANLTEGDKIIYKITVTNEGSTPIYNVPVYADIPDGTTFVSSEDGTSDGNTFYGNTIPSLAPGESVELYYTVVIDTLPTYEIDIPNIANVDGENTNSVLDKAYVGILVVKYLDHDGTELTATTTTRARVGTAYGTLPILDFANRAFDYVEGARIGSYIKGTITVIFHYKLIPATLTVRYYDKDTGEEIKTLDVYTGFYQGDIIPGTYAEEYAIDGYIYDSVVTPDPMQFVTTTAEIDHYYIRILDTDAPSVEKIASPASGEQVKAGDIITYTIAVTNVRATDALQNVVITDAVPAGTTVNSIANNGVEKNGVITWTIDSIAAGATKLVSFTVTVDSGLTGGSNLGNVAKVKYTDVQVGEDKEVTTNPTTHAIITSSKTSSVAEGTVLYEGDIITYTISVTNIGTAPASGIEIYDAVPSGTGLILDSLSTGADFDGTYVTATISSLLPGETKTVSFSVTISNMADDQFATVISNTAYVDGDKTNTTENIVKRGTLTVKYQDTAGNTLHDDIVTEGAVGTPFVLPAEKSFDKLRLAQVTYDSESTNFIEGNITYIYIYERIPATAIVKYLDYNTRASLLESKTFTGYVGDILDSDYYENITHYSYKMTDKPTVLEFTEEGLVIIHYYEYIYDSATIVREKIASPASGSLVKMGDEITYTVVVENPRYDAINNVIVTDSVPAGATFVSADNGGSYSNGTVTWNLGTLAAGASTAVTFTVKVNDSFSADSNLYNIAYVTFTGAGDSEPTTVVTNDTFHAVLSYNKEVAKSAANVGDVLTYSINVTNEGSIKAENVVVTDVVPAYTTLVESSIGDATYFNGGLTWNIATIEAGQTVTLSFKVTVDEMSANLFRETVVNQARVNGVQTNDVETVVTQGAVVVTHVTEDGTELKPAETVTGSVGTKYSFSEIESNVYKLKEVNGEPNDTFIEGVKYVEFVYAKRDGGLVVRYLEYGTDKVLRDTFTKSYKVNDVVESSFFEEIEQYEFVTTTYSPDNSMVMTKDGIEIIHYYKLIPTGDVVVKYVDVNGKEIAPSEESSGDIYTTYSYEPKDIEGYDYTRTEGEPSGFYPANDTTEVVFVYTRSTGVLVVRYLEQGTNKMLAENVVEVYNTGDTVSNIYYKDIDLYEYTYSSVPSSLVMTKDGIEVIHYYTLIPTGTATAHFIDRDGNELAVDQVKEGSIYDTYTFNAAEIPNWHLVEISGAESGNFPAYSNNDVYYIYEKDTGVLSIYYLEVGTGSTLSPMYSETMNVGKTVSDLHERSIDLYELVQSDIPESLKMTTDGLTITYWYRLIPTGDAIAYFVDTEGNNLLDAITAAGNIYETYSFSAVEIPGYKLIKTEGTESANFPANSTNTVVYTYDRCYGTLTVNYLEQGTGNVLAPQYTETMPTLTVVEDLHEKSIAYYNLASSEIPANLVMTEDGIVINYYYSQFAIGNVTAHYVDEDGNDLLAPVTTSDLVTKEYGFAPETIDGYKHTDTEGKPTGVYTEEDQHVYFIYTREKGVLTIKYLEEGTEKVLADSYTETMGTGITVTNLRNKSIPEYYKTSVVKPDSLVMTTDGITIIHYYKAIPIGYAVAKYVDTEGNTLADDINKSGNIENVYEFSAKEFDGYKLISVEGVEVGNFPANSTNTVIYTYERCTGVLTVNYLEKGTNKVLHEKYTEVIPTLTEVDDLHEESIEFYTLVEKDIPADLVMTEAGIVINYYYVEFATGTAIAHYVDDEGNELLADKTQTGYVTTEFGFSAEDIEGYKLVEIEGDESGVLTEDTQEVTYIYVREKGVLVISYLEEGTDKALADSYTEVIGTGITVTDLREKTIEDYEKTTTEKPDSLVMTTDGITIIHYYKAIPVGNAVAKYVDTEGNALRADIEKTGTIEKSYIFTALDFDGYKLVSVEGIEEANFPANDTNVVIYTYERCTGVLTVNYLEKGTNVILEAKYTEVIPTLVEVTDLHKKDIAYYNLVDSVIPKDLVMTEDGITITYYYDQISTGGVTVNYVDEGYNPLILPETVSGIVGDEFSFEPADIDGYKHIDTEGNPTGTLTEEAQTIYFIYTRERGVLVIKYLEEGTDKVLADTYTETMETGEEVTDVRAKGISGYVRTRTEQPESLVMTTEGIDITHYYTEIPSGTVKVSYVDEDGNDLIDGSSMTDKVETTYEYEAVEIPGYELVKVEGEPEGTITEEEQEVTFIYRRLDGTLHITYVDQTTGEQIAESYNEVFDVFEVVEDLKEQEIDGYTRTGADIPADLTMTTEGLDVVYYYTPETHKIGGTVWVEGNDDSTYSKINDLSLNGIKVVLYDGNKTVIGTDVTDNNGEFEIEGIVAGKYYVSFEVPSKYAVVDAINYSSTQTNSIADYTGKTGVLNLTDDMTNIGMGLEGIVLGSTATNDKDAADNYEEQKTPQTVYTPTVSTQQNATYTKVLGDTGTNPSTGDTTSAGSEEMTVIAVMLVSCSLFVLTLSKKKGSSVAHRR